LSKLLMMYAAAETAKLTVGPDGKPSIIVNTMCPGACKSDLGRQYYEKGLLYQLLLSIFTTFIAKSTEAGARTYIMATMTTPEEHGKFIRHYNTPEEYAQRSARVLTNPEGKALQKEVWKEILDILEAKVPGVKKIANQA